MKRPLHRGTWSPGRATAIVLAVALNLSPARAHAAPDRGEEAAAAEGEPGARNPADVRVESLPGSHTRGRLRNQRRTGARSRPGAVGAPAPTAPGGSGPVPSGGRGAPTATTVEPAEVPADPFSSMSHEAPMSSAEVERILEAEATAAPSNSIFAYKQKLVDAGITPSIQYSGLLWSNVHGGKSTGRQLTSFFAAAFDLDLEKLLGTWHGLTFRIGWNWYAGPSPTASLLGGLGSMSISFYEASNALRFYEIHLRQDFGESDRWSIEVGQMAADMDFMVSRYGAIFQNGTFGAFSSFTSFRNTTSVFRAPVYPLAAPGLLLRLAPLDGFLGRLGVYTADAGQDTDANWGFGWRLGHGGGATLFWEAEHDFRPAGRPGALTIGGWAVVGQERSRELPELRPSNLSFYAMLDQALLADAAGEPKLGLFARMGANEKLNANPIALSAEAGLNLYEPMEARPDDVVGLAFGTTRFGDDLRRLLGDIPRGESLLELTWTAKLASWLTLQPDLQYFFSPTFSRRDSLVFGLELSATY